MLCEEDFKPVTLADREFFERHSELYPQTHSSNTFTNMVCWNHFTQYRYAYVNGNIIISGTTGGITRFHPPIGPRDPELMRELIQLAMKVSDNTPLIFIDPDTALWIRELEPDLGWCRIEITLNMSTELPTLQNFPERNTRKSQPS